MQHAQSAAVPTGETYVMSPTVRATPFIYRASWHAFVESIFIVKQRTYSEIIY